MPFGLPVGFRAPVVNSSIASDVKENGTLEDIPNWAFCKAVLVPIAQCNTTEYKACAISMGVCVDSNNDFQPDQCVCPRFLSKRKSNIQGRSNGQRLDGGEAISYDTNWSSMNIILEKQVHSNKEWTSINSNFQCSTPLVRVACSTNTLLVCFYPPSSTPYQSLNQNLANGHAIAYFMGAEQSGQMMERSCVLTFSELRSRGLPPYRLNGAAADGHTALFADMEQHLCTYIDFSRQSAKRWPCGTTVYRNEVSFVSTNQTSVKNTELVSSGETRWNR
ncbi:unnamed protein product [Schistocephalus solidus]|uniref:Uncharacterized protein n=1 Tax=Schistocephalus solidus TaxID=70667 RepID=A0A183SKM0_SCHSO|nr:unnamed protein product [Schistocephalus solidus]